MKYAASPKFTSGQYKNDTAQKVRKILQNNSYFRFQIDGWVRDPIVDKLKADYTGTNGSDPFTLAINFVMHEVSGFDILKLNMIHCLSYINNLTFLQTYNENILQGLQSILQNISLKQNSKR